MGHTKASQDLFDEMVNILFCDIPGCLNQRDDLFIGANTWKKHTEPLKAVFQRAEDYRITFNEPKCEFGKAPQIIVYGYRFGLGGLKPTPGKVQAVSYFKSPKSK